MLAEERRKRVLDLVSHKGMMTLADLAGQIQVSESTIRRDLEHWGRQGVLRRTRGGAIYIGDAPALPPLDERTSSNIAEKLK